MIVIRWRQRHQTTALAPTLQQAYPTEEAAGFDDVLRAIDEAEMQVWDDRDPAGDTIE